MKHQSKLLLVVIGLAFSSTSCIGEEQSLAEGECEQDSRVLPGTVCRLNVEQVEELMDIQIPGNIENFTGELSSFQDTGASASFDLDQKAYEEFVLSTRQNNPEVAVGVTADHIDSQAAVLTRSISISQTQNTYNVRIGYVDF